MSATLRDDVLDLLEKDVFEEKDWETFLEKNVVLTEMEWADLFTDSDMSLSTIEFLLQKSIFPLEEQGGILPTMCILRKKRESLENRIRVLDYYFAIGGDVNEMGSAHGETILYRLVENALFLRESKSITDSNRLITFLLEKGADPSLKIKIGWSVFDLVARHGSLFPSPVMDWLTTKLREYE